MAAKRTRSKAIADSALALEVAIDNARRTVQYGGRHNAMGTPVAQVWANLTKRLQKLVAMAKTHLDLVDPERRDRLAAEQQAAKDRRDAEDKAHAERVAEQARLTAAARKAGTVTIVEAQEVA